MPHISEYDVETKFIDRLTELNTPYALIDSNWPEFHPVTFYGQDSVRSDLVSRIVAAYENDAQRQSDEGGMNHEVSSHEQ